MITTPAVSRTEDFHAWPLANDKTPASCPARVLIKPAMTYFRVVHTIMGPKCLTAVFGMGTGVATWVWSPARRFASFTFSARMLPHER